VRVLPPFFDVHATRYVDTGAPPSYFGFVNVTVALRVPAFTVGADGAPGGTGRATTADERAEAGPEPTLLFAVTVQR
jgi:hypothetical protein